MVNKPVCQLLYILFYYVGILDIKLLGSQVYTVYCEVLANSVEMISICIDLDALAKASDYIGLNNLHKLVLDDSNASILVSKDDSLHVVSLNV